MGWIAIALAIPLMMLLVGGVKNALPPGVSKGWAWLAAIFVFLLVAERTGLLESIGFDPRGHEVADRLRDGNGGAGRVHQPRSPSAAMNPSDTP